MTADERAVKERYPNCGIIWTSRGWRIIGDVTAADSDVIGRTDSGHVPEAAAWADARARIREKGEQR